MTWADRAQAEADLIDSPRRSGSARLARAYALLATDPGVAVTNAAAALQFFTAAADPISAGRAHLFLGTAGGGDIHFTRACDYFERSGAHLLVARTRRASR
jgi:hypothetical protein